MKPVVAIVGRPNAGKSTFFNRVTRTRDALVDDFPGVTRDRHYGDVQWDGVTFTVVDTGGFAQGDTDPFSPLIRHQVLETIADADAVVLLLDGKSGVSPFDRDMVDILRSEKKPVLGAVNKIDGIEQEDRLYEFYDLGLPRLYPVSAEHGYGVADFLDMLVAQLPVSVPDPSSETADGTIAVAVVGRPNAGKSSLINAILGQKRLLVSPVPGTTRDAIDTFFRLGRTDYRFIDTAGIRRKGRVSTRIEKFSVIKALKSLERCDVALIVLDAQEGITDQDISIAGYAHDRGCGCVFLLNKWDAVEKDVHTAKEYLKRLRMAAKFLSFAPAVTISALTGLRVAKIFPLVESVYAQYTTRLGTGQINRILEEAIARTPPPRHRGRPIKLYYGTQVSTRPPTFVCFFNYPKAVHFSYKRYLINQIRQASGLGKTPIRLLARQRSGRGRK